MPTCSSTAASGMSIECHGGLLACELAASQEFKKIEERAMRHKRIFNPNLPSDLEQMPNLLSFMQNSGGSCSRRSRQR